VKIRLMRVGKKKQPTYRVVVADSRMPRDGRIIETIGHYGPRQDPSLIDIDGDKALDWLRKGAQPTEQVQKLLTVTGVWATFASEKKGPIVTKLNRRGYATGKVTTTKGKKKPEEPKPEEPKPEEPKAEEPAAPAAEKTAEAPAAEAAAEPEPPAAEGAAPPAAEEPSE
jgi:small subunit ribosomal protein S16